MRKCNIFDLFSREAVLVSNSYRKHIRKMAKNREDLDKCFEVVSELVQRVGKIIGERYNKAKNVQQKLNHVDLVTETDREVEDLLIGSLSAAFPHHRFIGEETTSGGKKVELTDSPTWIIDPVDGTVNFVHSYPNSCVSIAFLVNKVAELAIIYNPILQQLFTARRGRGAFFNGNKMHVSGQTDITKSLIITDIFAYRQPEKLDTILENIQKIINVSHGIRMLGSAALSLSMVALGGCDAFFETGLHAWDMAAGDLIVREAGGVVIDPSGGPLDLMSRRVLAAATPELASELTKMLTQYYPLPRD